MTVVKSQSATLTNVASSTSSVTLFAAAASPRGRTIWNDSSAILYVKFGSSASATSCTVPIAANGYYEFPVPLYSGIVTGAWACD